MRITLLHNPKAGRGQHDRKSLVRALKEAGHKTRYRSTKSKGWKKALNKKADIVLAAGGDGAIAKVAARLVDRDIPLAILPFGTANNLARSLGFFESPRKVIDDLKDGHQRAFDVGVARAPWGERLFFEGAGGGLLADYVLAAKRREKQYDERKTKEQPSKVQELAGHIKRMRDKLREYPAQEWTLKLDGKDISARYILWEAMNIASIGPALYLAPRAATEDGRFDFVCVREEDRELLLKHFDARLSGEKTKFPLPIQRFKKLKIVWDGAPIHFDDAIWPDEDEKARKPAKIKIKVKPSALKILQPPQPASR